MQTQSTIASQIAHIKNNGVIAAFNQVASETGLDRNLLLAIASRESGMGKKLDANWLGDNGNGIGLMQIDRRYHKDFAASYAPNNHLANIRYSAEFLQSNLRKFPGNLHAAIAAYNTGADSVNEALRLKLDPDLYTTGQDYSKDVESRYHLINKHFGYGKDTDFQKNVAVALLAGAAVILYGTLNFSKGK